MQTAIDTLRERQRELLDAIRQDASHAEFAARCRPDLHKNIPGFIGNISANTTDAAEIGYAIDRLEAKAPAGSPVTSETLVVDGKTPIPDKIVFRSGNADAPDFPFPPPLPLQIGQPVTLNRSKETGAVIAVTEFARRPPLYLVEYLSGNCQQVEAWFDREALTAT